LWAIKPSRLSLSPSQKSGGGLHHHKPCILTGPWVFLQSKASHGMGFLRHAKSKQRFRSMTPGLRPG
jgi:hypothetical protein